MYLNFIKRLNKLPFVGAGSGNAPDASYSVGHLAKGFLYNILKCKKK